jgi:hypothetical protein
MKAKMFSILLILFNWLLLVVPAAPLVPAPLSKQNSEEKLEIKNQ